MKITIFLSIIPEFLQVVFCKPIGMWNNVYLFTLDCPPTPVTQSVWEKICCLFTSTTIITSCTHSNNYDNYFLCPILKMFVCWRRKISCRAAVASKVDLKLFTTIKSFYLKKKFFSLVSYPRPFFHFTAQIFLVDFGDCSRGWPKGSFFNSYYTEL